MGADVLGWRGKLGILVPATNTVAEPELAVLAPPGVTHHTGRIRISTLTIASDADVIRLVRGLEAELSEALETLMACAPAGVLLAATALSVWGGRLAAETRLAALEARAGVPVTGGAAALAAELDRLGARRVGVVSPYQPVLDAQMRGYLAEGGVEVLAFPSHRCPSPLAIAATPPPATAALIRAHDTDRIEAWLQVGTNLPFAAAAPGLAAEMGKPVLAVNPVSHAAALAAAGLA